MLRLVARSGGVGDDGAMATTVRRPVLRVTLAGDGAATGTRRPDTLAVEEPLEIRLGDDPFTVTMRTPGHDVELALGFLVGEGLVHDPDDVLGARHCPDAARGPDGEPTHNVVEVVLAARVGPPPRALPRRVTSACGRSRPAATRPSSSG